MRWSGATTICTSVLPITVFIGPESTRRRSPIRVARTDRSAEAFRSETAAAAGSEQRVAAKNDLAYGGNLRGGGGALMRS
jgi:hypothetical protein